jgi:hypothetical protein
MMTAEVDKIATAGQIVVDIASGYMFPFCQSFIMLTPGAMLNPFKPASRHCSLLGSRQPLTRLVLVGQECHRRVTRRPGQPALTIALARPDIDVVSTDQVEDMTAIAIAAAESSNANNMTVVVAGELLYILDVYKYTHCVTLRSWTASCRTFGRSKGLHSSLISCRTCKFLRLYVSPTHPP